jgi:hypothetical protein
MARRFYLPRHSGRSFDRGKRYSFSISWDALEGETVSTVGALGDDFGIVTVWAFEIRTVDREAIRIARFCRRAQEHLDLQRVLSVPAGKRRREGYAKPSSVKSSTSTFCRESLLPYCVSNGSGGGPLMLSATGLWSLAHGLLFWAFAQQRSASASAVFASRIQQHRNFRFGWKDTQGRKPALHNGQRTSQPHRTLGRA